MFTYSLSFENFYISEILVAFSLTPHGSRIRFSRFDE